MHSAFFYIIVSGCQKAAKKNEINIYAYIFIWTRLSLMRNKTSAIGRSSPSEHICTNIYQFTYGSPFDTRTIIGNYVLLYKKALHFVLS
ncbi:MAG: hypothetical protein H6Q59_864 [Firmicutes bacterium]|nr:hypothetical protein [Bacillota bacterium]